MWTYCVLGNKCTVYVRWIQPSLNTWHKQNSSHTCNFFLAFLWNRLRIIYGLICWVTLKLRAITTTHLHLWIGNWVWKCLILSHSLWLCKRCYHRSTPAIHSIHSINVNDAFIRTSHMLEVIVTSYHCNVNRLGWILWAICPRNTSQAGGRRLLFDWAVAVNRILQQDKWVSTLMDLYTVWALTLYKHFRGLITVSSA